MQSYPLTVQYRVENVTDKPKAFQCEFLSEKFFSEAIEVNKGLRSPRRNTGYSRRSASI